ncbi:MAG: hypothetical protein P1V51_24665 [Deltaproteobacteria bacterium]|nr:hypothetical protein [Deltaproteobacteria bacterium]
MTLAVEPAFDASPLHRPRERLLPERRARQIAFGSARWLFLLWALSLLALVLYLLY